MRSGLGRRGPPLQDTRFGPLFTKPVRANEDEADEELDEDDEDVQNDES